jgi:hypothetical protein
MSAKNGVAEPITAREYTRIMTNSTLRMVVWLDRPQVEEDSLAGDRDRVKASVGLVKTWDGRLRRLLLRRPGRPGTRPFWKEGGVVSFPG